MATQYKYCPLACARPLPSRPPCSALNVLHGRRAAQSSVKRSAACSPFRTGSSDLRSPLSWKSHMYLRGEEMREVETMRRGVKPPGSGLWLPKPLGCGRCGAVSHS